MHPVFLKIGSFELASYGLMTALGYAAACLYLVPRLKKISLDMSLISTSLDAIIIRNIRFIKIFMCYYIN